MDQDLIDKFVKDPDWIRMEKFIRSFFEAETDITAIDTDRDSSTIHAEVIARKRIANDLNKLFGTLNNARNGKTLTKIRYE